MLQSLKNIFADNQSLNAETENNEIDLEIRIHEGQQARVNKVTVNGNTKTNDHVVMREIRTKPGDLFKRSDIIRTQREFAALDYFNPETLGNIDIQPEEIFTYLRDTDENNFLKTLSNISDIKWNDTVMLFHDMNSLFILYYRKRKRDNKTRKVHIINKIKKKLRKKYTRKRT